MCPMPASKAGEDSLNPMEVFFREVVSGNPALNRLRRITFGFTPGGISGTPQGLPDRGPA